MDYKEQELVCATYFGQTSYENILIHLLVYLRLIKVASHFLSFQYEE